MSDGGHGSGPRAGVFDSGYRTGEQQRWWLYRGTGQPLDLVERDSRWPKPPPWRVFDSTGNLPTPAQDEAEEKRRLGTVSVVQTSLPPVVSMINASIYLRRPLLVTGRPGSGKSALAYMISRELRLGRVVRWPITSRTTLQSGLYTYDALGRAQAINSGGDAGIGNYINLGPLGTALLPHRLPRILLIDEFDKSDVDLPNDLLSIFEEGDFPITELVRVRDREPEVVVHTADRGVKAPVRDGIVRCNAFPIVVITSNEEREFPAAFLRRCLTLTIPEPDTDRLADMVAAHFQGDAAELTPDLVELFTDARRKRDGLAIDQLLNAVHLATSGVFDDQDSTVKDQLLDAIWHRLSVGLP